MFLDEIVFGRKCFWMSFFSNLDASVPNRWNFEFLTALKGTPWNPNPAARKMAADALPADKAVLMPVPAPVPQVVVAAALVDRAASRLYIRRFDGRHDGSRTH